MINDRTTHLIEVIEKNPGIKYREIMRFTGLKNGVLSHYLDKLVKYGLVQVVRQPRQTRFYPLSVSETESKIIKNLRRNTTRKIIHALMVHKDGLSFNEIVENVNKAPSTVSFYISQLVDDDILSLTLHERKKKFLVRDRETVDKLIEDYQPGLLDKPVTGLEDIINAL